MCDFKVGDEVVCVDDTIGDGPGFGWLNPLVLGRIYQVSGAALDPRSESCNTGETVVFLAGHPNPGIDGSGDFGFFASRFRKVRRQNPRLSIESFLTIKPGFEEPRVVPNKTPVRA